MRFWIPGASRPRRCCALAGALSITAGLVLFPLAAAGPPAALAATTGRMSPASQAARLSDAAAAQVSVASSRVTVHGPKMFNPATKHSAFKVASTVTVSQTRHLTNQEVLVTWKHFTPSNLPTYQAQVTNYPVMVAECKGTHPTSPGQCFGAENGGVPGSFSAFGPMNTVYSATAKNGTGVTQIQLLTGQEDQQLGCDVGVPCSLAIVPSQGGNPNFFNQQTGQQEPHCNDHTTDDVSSHGASAFSLLPADFQCSWKKRIVVPLFFSPNPADCPIAGANFTAIGSPMLARAMSQWQSALCSRSSDPLSIQYDSAQSEPLARVDFLDGSDDIALTTLPATGTGKHPFTYAPLAVSAVSFAYWVDNPNTGRPRANLRFDPRLIAKLLTQSYDFQGNGCGSGPPPAGVGCDNAVDNNPLTLYDDPEFKHLNPHVAPVGLGFEVPTVLSGESDMTTTMTRWIAASKPAKSFVDGTFDPWGMHVNTDYLRMQLPTNAFASMDPYPLIAHRYAPVFPLSLVAQYQADNWYPATDFEKDPTGNFPKLQPQTPGNRDLFAVLDEGDTASFLLPSAALLNPAGKYVKPSKASMAAAVSEMTTASNHITQQMPVNGKAKNAYPLTMVIYAMVPTGGISQQKAAKIAQFLDFVAGPGQQPGTLPGDLPPGYLPLNAKQRAQTLAAAQAVLNQAGKKNGHRPGSGSSPSPSATPSPSPSPSASPVPTPSPSASQHVVSLGFVSNPTSSGLARFALPFLLITGGLLALAGSSVLVAGRTSTAVAARLRRLRLPWRSKP
jgi:hypothetical protein